MEENNKVYVFEKKEILLLVVFILVLASTSFTIGVRMGLNWKMDEAGITKEDKDQLILKSQSEENADAALKDSEVKSKPIKDEAFNKLKQEFDKLNNENLQVESANIPDAEESTEPDSAKLIDNYELSQAPANPEPAVANESPAVETNTDYRGKYTVQVGAYNNLDDAKQFAAGFEVRGYTPIINEVEIDNKGKWYRVSIGIFESRQEAKDYIINQKTLFQSYDYIINQIE